MFDHIDVNNLERDADGIAVLDIDLYDDAVLDNPYPAHDLIRAAGPVVYLRKYGVYAMARYRDVHPALRDWEALSNEGGFGLADIRKPDAWRAPSPLGEVDPPRHTEVRAVFQRVLSPLALKALRETFEIEAEALVGRLVPKGEFDAVSDYAETFVATATPRAIGFREEEGRNEKLFALGEWNFNGQGPRNQLFEDSNAKAQELLEWYERAQDRESLLPGGFGMAFYEAADRGEVDHVTARLFVRALVRGGLDTTSSALSAAVWYLAQDPEQWAMLKADPNLARTAIDEAIRLETPIQMAYRLTTRPVEVDGLTVPADRKIAVMINAANRDPAKWENPDKFDLRRQLMGHVALGNGIHMCVGQMLARMEGEIALRALVARVERIELAGPVVRRINNNLRSLRSAPVRVWA